MTQLQNLATHLLDGKSITPMEAKEVYGITRLAARIHEIRCFTKTEIRSELFHDEVGKRYAKYWLESGKRNLSRFLSA